MEPIITQQVGIRLDTAPGLLIVPTGALTTDYMTFLSLHSLLIPLSFPPQATPLLLF